jgi:chemotaxis response regulator CheB
MLDLAIAVCRDPEPGDAGEALDAIGAGLVAARALLDTEGGVRGALDLLFRSVARAATERLPSVPFAGSRDGETSLTNAPLVSRG